MQHKISKKTHAKIKNIWIFTQSKFFGNGVAIIKRYDKEIDKIDCTFFNLYKRAIKIFVYKTHFI